MSGFSQPFRDHLESECTTTCHCWRVARRDGRVFGFTDHDRPLTVAGQLYEPESGLAQSEVRASAGMAIDGTDVEGALSSDRLTEEDIEAGLFDDAEVETLLVNWDAPAQFAMLRKASVGKITRADGRFLAELQSLAASLDRPNGRYIRRACDAELGDARCGADLSGGAMRGAGVVVSLPGPSTVAVQGLDSFGEGWFSNGCITWTSGDLQGRMAAVADHRVRAGRAELLLPVTATMPAAGSGFSVVAGCDKSFATCKAKFSNTTNFRGFPHLPGNDAAYGYVVEGGQFDGGALVE